MAFGTSHKGSRTERELMHKLMDRGFFAIRAAGSGSGSPCPDVLAFRRTEQFGFECKAINKPNLALRVEQLENLKIWQENTGITTYVAWRLKGGAWLLIRPEHFAKNAKSYSISLKEAQKIGVGLEEIIGPLANKEVLPS